MKYKLIFPLIALAFCAQAKPIVGSASFQHFGPATKELTERARPVAAAAFKQDFIFWLREEMRIDADTANTIKKFAIDRLTASCLEATEVKSATKGRVWTISLIVDEGTARNMIDAHNAHYEVIAVSKWAEFNSLIESDTVAAFTAAATSLASAAARIVTAEAMSRVGQYKYDDIRLRLQALFDKLAVKANVPVIEGRPGSRPAKPPVATVKIGDNPVAGFQFTAFVQNGREIGRITTTEQGELPMSDHVIPFVHNSSMLTVSPDARSYLRARDFIRFRDMGIRSTRGQELTFIYKVPTLTYTLEYRAATDDNSIIIPADFSDAGHIRKFLKDSCNLQAAASGAAADLNVKIGAAFSKATHDNLEEDAVVMKARAEFRGGGINLVDSTTLDKRYGFGSKAQMGEYFWEATRALRGLIRGTLDREGKK